jgi:tetratricopeptide (TPR) repeat protein
MKRTILQFAFLLSVVTSFSQSPLMDSVLQKIAEEKNDSLHLVLINRSIPNLIETNPALDMENNEKLLLQSQQNKDKLGEAVALTDIGYDYRSFGNFTKGLEYSLKAVATAEETGNEGLITLTKAHLAHNYKDQGNYRKAITLYQQCEALAIKLNNNFNRMSCYLNLAQVYLAMNKLDSAFIYSHRAYELSTQFHIISNLDYLFAIMGNIQSKMGNPGLAVSYFNMALAESIKEHSPKQVNLIYSNIAEHYYNNHQNDSALFYAKKAISAVEHTPFSNKSLDAARLLADIYNSRNADSTVKYLKIYVSIKDSLFNEKAIRESQEMTFEDEVRQQQAAMEKAKAEEQQKQNIEYALVALGIVTFIILFLLLSRSFITNERVIGFFSVVALLLVFEFLNLLLHPFLGGITNHSPALMLLGLVCVAVLLVPLHHRLEKWVKEKLVEKNKQIRLAEAKKTIEQLEKEKPGD